MSAISARYAKALFALAKEQDTLERTAEEIARVATLASDPQIASVLGNPLLTPTYRRELVTTFTRELSLSELLAHFLGVLADHQRLGELAGVARHFDHLLDRELQRVRITIRSPTALNPQHEAALIAAFEHRTGKHVLVQRVDDPALLGGVVVEVEGTVYDGSVRTQLERLAKTLAGTASL